MPSAHKNMAPALQAAWHTQGGETLGARKNPQASASHFAIPASQAAAVGQAARPCHRCWSIWDPCQGSLLHPCPMEAGTLSQDKDAAGHPIVAGSLAHWDADSRHRDSIPAQHRQLSVLRAWGSSPSMLPLLPIWSSRASLQPQTRPPSKKGLFSRPFLSNATTTCFVCAPR